MPIPEDIVRVRLLFQLGSTGPLDQAVFGFHMKRLHQTGNTTQWQQDVQEISDKVADKWASNVTQKSMFSVDVSLAAVQAYHLDAATGHTLDKGQTAATSTRAWKGSAQTGSAPFQTSMAVSLYAYQPGTFDPLKRHKQGRFYLPPLRCDSMGLGPQAGLYDATIRDAVATGVNAFLEDVEGMFIGPTGGALSQDVMQLVVVSASQNAAYPVVASRFGLRPDVQRRRANKLPENYANHTLTPA